MFRNRCLRALVCVVALVALLPAPAAAVDPPIDGLPSIDVSAPADSAGASSGQAALQPADGNAVPAQQTIEPLPTLAAVTDLEGEWRAPGVVSVDWSDVPDADGYEITVLASGEWLLLDPRSDIAGVVIEFDGSSALVAGLPADASSHWFAVRARNAQGLAPWSNSVEVEVSASTAAGASELASFDPFTTPTRSGIDLERLREAAATITPEQADCDSVPALDVAGVTVVEPPADLGDSDAAPTVLEVVRIAGACLVVEYVELDGRTAAQMRELLAGDDSVFAAGVPPRDVQTAHDDGAHAPHTGGHHTDGAGEQWHLPQPMIDRLWAGWKDENPVTVAVLDTGVDEDHPDLEDQIVTGGLDACHREGSTSHGTLMAGIIAAKLDRGTTPDTYVAGVAPNAKLLPIHVAPPEGTPTAEGCTPLGPYTAAVATAVNSGARVINLSLSVDIGIDGDNTQNVGGVEISSRVTDDTFELASRAAAMLGVVVVTSAGNCGNPLEVTTKDGHTVPHFETQGCSEHNEQSAPAAYSLQGDVITVAAIDESGQRAAFSTMSDLVDVSAPGVGILTTEKCTSVGVCGTDDAGGTSAAAAYVSGVVAHMLNRHPAATVGQVRAALEYSAAMPPAIRPPVPAPHSLVVPRLRGRDGDDRIVPPPTREFGRGIVDPAGAVTQLGRLLLGGVTPKGPHGGFVQVSAGSEHTCGLRASGQVRCWGDSDVADETPVLAFASLSSPPTAGYVCGVRIDGAVQCWGDVPAVLATAVAGSDMADAPDGRFTEIAVGDAHVCGLRPAGGVVCWGDSSNDRTAVPFDRFGSEADDRATAIVAGAAHTCAITGSSDLVCWGDDSEGQLPPSTLPWAVREVAAGAAHTCVVNVNSKVSCWGDNDHGQRGAPSGRLEGISAGADHTCARDAETDSAVCWGFNLLGQSDAPTGRLAHVSAGGRHTCALDPFASLTCWGDNQFGQSNPAVLASLTLTDTDSGLDLLAGDFDSGTFEYTVDAVADAVRVGWTRSDGARLGLAVTAFDADGDEVAEGGSVRLTPGAVLRIRVSSLWGFGPERVYKVTAEDPPRLLSLSMRNVIGGFDCPGAGCRRLYLNPEFDPDFLWYRTSVWPYVSLLTVEFTAAGGAVTVTPADADAAVEGHQVALTSTTGFASVDAGSLHTCGLRSGGSVRCWGASYPTVTDVPSGRYSQVSTGWGHACAVTTGGSVRCWGDDEFGQSQPPSGRFSSVSAGWGHTCGLKTDKTVACWGYNFSGQSRPPDGMFSAVAAGGNHSCGILTSGSLRCWGLNSSRQASPPGGTFMSVSAGWRHTCAVKDDATVACWGNNGSGQTAAPTGKFSSVSAGEGHSCGLKTDKTVACWGANDSGQARVPAGAFVSVSAGQHHSCSLNAAGTVVCRGSTSAAWAALDHRLVITVSSSVEPVRRTVYTVLIDRVFFVVSPEAQGGADAVDAARNAIIEAADPSAKTRAAPASDSAAACTPTVIRFADAELRSGVEAALGKNAGEPISPSELAGLTELRLPRNGDNADAPAIVDLSGLGGATGLRVLDLAGHSASDVSALSCLGRLETLVLSANPIADTAPLSALTTLTTLWLDRTGIDDLSDLASLTGLRRLFVYGNSIDDISDISALSSLTDLYLDHNAIDGIAAVSSLTGLARLGLGGNDITSLDAVQALHGLEHLYAYDNELTDIGVVSGLSGLDSLWASGNTLTEVSAVGQLAGLDYADVRLNRVSDVSPLNALTGVVHAVPQQDGVVAFADGVLAAVVRAALGQVSDETVTEAQLGKLKTLSHFGSDSAGRIRDLSGLEHAVSLTELKLRDHRVRDVSPLAGLRSLVALDLQQNGFADLAQLASLTRLKLLGLIGNGIASLDALPVMAGLEKLYLDINRISDVSRLAGFTGLDRLGLASNGISDIAPLAHLTRVDTLTLSDNPLMDIDALAGLADLAYLEMNWTGAADLTPLGRLGNLVVLDAAGNGITSIDALRGHAALVSLYLDDNQISDIAPLAGLRQLRTMYIARNRITDFTSLEPLERLTVHGHDQQAPPPATQQDKE